jgi:oxalate decarboxylase
MKPQHMTTSGNVRVVDSTIFPASRNFAVAFVVVKPGGLRELHWHPTDEWQYWVSGRGRMTIFFNGARARTQDFVAGDVGFVPRTLGHYVENTGETDLIFIEVFLVAKYSDFSLNAWLTHLPSELVQQHLNISNETLDGIPDKNYALLPQ